MKQSLITRSRVIYLIVPAVLAIIILVLGVVISRGIAYDSARRMARQYSIEATANFQIFMNPHMSLMRQLSLSTSVGYWMNDSQNNEAKARAFETAMAYTLMLPDAYIMFTVYETRIPYRFNVGLEFDEFLGAARPVNGGEYGWFAQTMAAEQPFILNIQRTVMDAHGNWGLYIWTNHRVYYSGQLVGVVTVGSPFDQVRDAVFAQFEDGTKRGYILDRHGRVRLDSAGILETEYQGAPTRPEVPEAASNPALAQSKHNHLSALRDGYFQIGTPTYGTIRLDEGAYRYASISPIVGTDWSILVLSGRPAAVGAQYTPLVLLGFAMILMTAIFGGIFAHRIDSSEQQKKNDAMDKMQQILDHAPLIINQWDETDTLIKSNKQAIEWFKTNTEEEYIGNFHAFAPEFQPCGTPSGELAMHFINEAREKGFISFEWTGLATDGEEIPMYVNLTNTYFKGKKVQYGFVSDLREIKKMEAKLRANEINERTRLIIDACPACITVYSAERVMIDCNNVAAQMFGLENREGLIEAANKNFMDFFPEVQPCGTASEEKIQWGFDQAQANGYLRVECEHLTLQNERLPTEETITRVDYDDTFMFVVYLRDLREERRNELVRTEALENERTLYEMNQILIDSSPYIISLWDENFKMVRASHAAVARFGVESAQEFVDNFDLFSPKFQPDGSSSAESARRLMQQAYEQGELTFEWMHQTKTGELLPSEITAKRYAGDNKLIVYNHDMREVRKLEAARLAAVEDASRAKSRFLARMSHEIRTPLTAVLGISEMQLRDGTLPPQTEEGFSKIYSASRTLLAIVNDILDFSRIESGRITLMDESYSVAQLISSVAQLHLLYAESANVKFRMEISEDLPMHLIGDELRIKQIISNLLTNAFKYTKEGNVSLHIYCEDADDETLRLVISIKDTGIGMTKEQIAQLKGEYVRLHEQEMPFVSGTGLGIPIVSNLAQIMGADFDLRSVVGTGTEAYISIPQTKTDSEVLGAETVKLLHNFEFNNVSIMKELEFVPPQLEGSVLVVDDVDTNLYVVEVMLLAFGLKPELCDSGTQAIEKIKAGNVYDLILMDHMMPEPNGVETTRTLRKMGYNRPIVALTANALKGQAGNYIQNGFDGFMSKPIDIKMLNAYLMRYMP